MPLCSHCGAPGANKQCTACHSVTYCGADCQRAAWKGHKKACKAIKRLRQSAPAPGAATEELTPGEHPFSGASLAAREIVIVDAYTGYADPPPVMPMTWRVLPDGTGALGRQLVLDPIIAQRRRRSSSSSSTSGAGRIELCQLLVEALLVLEHGCYSSGMARLEAKQAGAGSSGLKRSIKGVLVVELNGCRIEELMSGEGGEALHAAARIAMVVVEYPNLERYVRARWKEARPEMAGTEELSDMVAHLFETLADMPTGCTPVLAVYAHAQDVGGFSMNSMNVGQPMKDGAGNLVDKLAGMAGLHCAPQALQLAPRTGELTFFDFDPSNHKSFAVPGSAGMSASRAQKQCDKEGYLPRPPSADRSKGVLCLQSNTALGEAIHKLLTDKRAYILGFAASCFKQHGKGALFIMSRYGIDAITGTNPDWDFTWNKESAAAVRAAPTCSRRLDRQVAMAWGRLAGPDPPRCMSLDGLCSDMRAYTTTLRSCVGDTSGEDAFMCVVCADPTGKMLPEQLRPNFRVPSRAVVPNPAPCSVSVVGPVPFAGAGAKTTGAAAMKLFAKLGREYFPNGESAVFANYDRDGDDPSGMQ